MVACSWAVHCDGLKRGERLVHCTCSTVHKLFAWNVHRRSSQVTRYQTGKAVWKQHTQDPSTTGHPDTASRQRIQTTTATDSMCICCATNNESQWTINTKQRHQQKQDFDPVSASGPEKGNREAAKPESAAKKAIRLCTNWPRTHKRRHGLFTRATKTLPTIRHEAQNLACDQSQLQSSSLLKQWPYSICTSFSPP